MNDLQTCCMERTIGFLLSLRFARELADINADVQQLPRELGDSNGSQTAGKQHHRRQQQHTDLIARQCEQTQDAPGGACCATPRCLL